MINSQNISKSIISSIIVYGIILVFWITLCLLHLAQTPFGHRNHDFPNHITYTVIIAKEHRLPDPYEEWETFQPPLYYLINNFISPESFKFKDTNHIKYVRYLSVLYGAVAILGMGWLIRSLNLNILLEMIVLLFIATTPAYVFTFTSYNNDSLATMLCIAICALTYKLYCNWSKYLAAILLIVTTAALYTKTTAILCIGILTVFCLKNLFRLKLPDKNQIKIICIFIISLFLLTPYLVLHNYKHTSKFFPTNYDKEAKNQNYCAQYNFDKIQIKNLTGILFRIPNLQIKPPDYTHEFDEPWVYPDWHKSHVATKRYDYFSFAFITSVIGEYVFETPGKNVIWSLLLIHLVIFLISLKEIFKTSIAKFSFFVIFLSHLIQVFSIPMFPDLPHRNMDYRYLCWNWIFWAVLYASTLLDKNKILKYSLSRLFIVGIIIQVYVLATVSGGFWL